MSGKVTDYWVLGAGASVAKPWGPGYNVNQVFVGRG